MSAAAASNGPGGDSASGGGGSAASPAQGVGPASPSGEGAASFSSSKTTPSQPTGRSKRKSATSSENGPARQRRNAALDTLDDSPALPTPGFTFWHFQGNVDTLFHKKLIDNEWRAFCRLCGSLDSLSVGSGGKQNLIFHLNGQAHAKVTCFARIASTTYIRRPVVDSRGLRAFVCLRLYYSDSRSFRLTWTSAQRRTRR